MPKYDKGLELRCATIGSAYSIGRGAARPSHFHVERIKSANSQWWERSSICLSCTGREGDQTTRTSPRNNRGARSMLVQTEFRISCCHSDSQVRTWCVTPLHA